MKHKMLLLSKSPSTGIGLRSYLDHIFGQYIDLEACLTDIVSEELLKRFDLVLFASDEAAKGAEPFMTPEVHSIRCVRTFNYTYLHRILSIPAGADVYVINDSLRNSEMAAERLKQMGLTQYQYIPYFPGVSEDDPSIHFAVTIGETRLVPKYIPNVVDVGIRVADISTISEIVSFFGLPMSLVDEVTKNFINQYVQLLKISNYRLAQANNSKFLTQSIISNIRTGVCVLNSRWTIAMINRPFMAMMEIEKAHPVGSMLDEAAPEFAATLKQTLDKGESHLNVERRDGETVVLTLQEIEDSGHEKLLLIHGVGQPASGGKTAGESRRAVSYHFSDYLTLNEKTKMMLETARRLSLTDYRILIEGETGTGKKLLAQAIHNNSGNSLYPFFRLHLSALSEEQMKKSLEQIYGGEIFGTRRKGTLYLEGVHCLSEKLQREVLRLLDDMPELRIISSSSYSLYQACREQVFLPELFYRLNEASLYIEPIRKRPEDIRLLFEHFLRNSYGNHTLVWEEVFTEGLCRALTQYAWPGNVKEVANLCKYFSCVRNGSRLSGRDLPPYILEQLREKREKLAPLERELLTLICHNPKIGRQKIYEHLREQGTEVTEGKIRISLQSLSERRLIKMNRTRGGCEITEEGEILL